MSAPVATAPPDPAARPIDPPHLPSEPEPEMPHVPDAPDMPSLVPPILVPAT